MNDTIRQILATHGRLAVDVATLDDNADLYRSGLTSHASVTVMLACEDEFDIEFPADKMKKSTFASITSIRECLTELGVTAGAAR